MQREESCCQTRDISNKKKKLYFDVGLEKFSLHTCLIGRYAMVSILFLLISFGEKLRHFPCPPDASYILRQNVTLRSLYSNSPSTYVVFSYKERNKIVKFYSCYNFVTLRVMTEKTARVEVT